MGHTFSICPQCNSLNRVNSENALKKTPTCGKCQAELNMHGLVSDVNGDGLRRILAKADKPVLVDFWASWCGPCKMYGPEFEKASRENTDAIFLKINTEADPQTASQFGVRGIPLTLVFKNGKEVKRQSGAMSSAQVSQLKN